MGPLEVEFDEDRVVGVMHLDQRVALVGERGPRLVEVAADLIGAVEDVAGRDDLVAGMAEGGDRRLELVAVLGVHVLADVRLASVAEGGR